MPVSASRVPREEQSLVATSVVETVGVGDSFTAGLLHHLDSTH
ncbi:hypothetical protein [Streptomyces sp. NPDC021212]